MKNSKTLHSKPGNDFYPWAIWIWNLKISKKEMIDQLNDFLSMGFKGIAIRPGRDMVPMYLSDEFLDLFSTVLLIANEKNIQIRIADDFSQLWNSPFERQLVSSKSLRAQYLVLEQLVSANSHNDITINLSDPENTILLAVKYVDQHLILSETKVLNVKAEVNSLLWRAQEGNWKVFVFRKEYVVSGSGSYLPNVFNPKAAQSYIQLVLEPLKTHCVTGSLSSFCGFINEFPAYRPGDNAIPWSDELVQKYKATYKKDLIKLLPQLFSEHCVQSQRVRSQFYSFLTEAMHDQFTAQLESWAKKNHLSQWVLFADKNTVKGTHELPVEQTPSSLEISSAGLQNIDGIGENYASLKMFFNVNCLEKSREVITVLGRNRAGHSGTVQSLKNEYDLSLLIGPSKILIDGFYFNIDPRGCLKSPNNPSWYSSERGYMKKLCDYMAKSADLLKGMQQTPAVAVLSPVMDIFSDYYPNHSDYARKGYSLYEKTVLALNRLNVPFNVLSEDCLLTNSIQGARFEIASRTNSNMYEALIVPFCSLISKSLLTACEKFAAKGIKIYFINEAPKGTIEDGITSQITVKLDKLFDTHRDTIRIINADLIEEMLASLRSQAVVCVNNKRGSDIYMTSNIGENRTAYIIHNRSESKDYLADMELPECKHFSIADMETGEHIEIEQVERKDDVCQLLLNCSPGSTYFLIASSAKESTTSFSKLPKTCVNPYNMETRNYRIVFKDQWTFRAGSLNGLPVGNWSVRIGLSKEFGGVSQFYESTFQIKCVPSACLFVLPGVALQKILKRNSEASIELNVNGMKAETLTEKMLSEIIDTPGIESAGFATIDNGAYRLFSNHGAVYNVKDLLVKGSNRISIRTAANSGNPQSLQYPPILLGDFTISKGQNGWVVDKTEINVGYSSWGKYGFPYLTGRGTYYQTFEIPNEYSRLVLRFSQVSGTIDIKINDKDLGTFNWHPMEIDITSFCEPKRNELVVGVLNTLDNIIRMNGRPSGLIGEVFLDVY